MTIRRGTLYVGVFLLAAGGVTLAAAANVLDRTATANAVGALWPLAVIAIGAGLVLRRSPAALAAGVIAAAIPGLALGASVVAVPDLAVPCTDVTSPTRVTETRTGSFGAAAEVDLRLDCGELDLVTAPGNAWRVEARDGERRRTDVTTGADGLRVDASGTSRRWSVGAGRVDWDVTLPTAATLDLTTEINAGRGRLDLDGARLGTLDLEVNAGDLRADLQGASLGRLDLELNAGSARVTLPADAFSGDLAVNAGSLEVCVPDGLGLRVRSSASLGSVHTAGLVRNGDAWETPGYATAPIKADLAAEANVGSITFDPQGGCQ